MRVLASASIRRSPRKPGRHAGGLAGTLVQTVAETLVPLIVGNLIRPGLPVCSASGRSFRICAPAPSPAAAARKFLLTAAAVQMCRFYDLQARSAPA